MSLTVSTAAATPLSPMPGSMAPSAPMSAAPATTAAPDLATALAGLQQALAGLSAVLAQMTAGGTAAATGATGGGAALGDTCSHCGGGTGAPMKFDEASASAELQPPIAGAPAQGAPPAGAPAQAGPSPAYDTAPLKVKGVDVNPEQRENIKQVLQVGKEMGANRKVLESAVATMIQESTAKNLDTAVDHDSLGLFQQRPSQGWGTPEQVLDPKHAARKYFEKAIESDRKDPGQAMTLLAQSVQRSGFPDAYAQWGGEAKAAVDAFGA